MAKKIIISGIVQGVGMRHFVSVQARKNSLLGYVRNISNGQVECLIQGDETNIKAFLKTLRTQAPGQIDDLDIEDTNLNQKLESFSIKF